MDLGDRQCFQAAGVRGGRARYVRSVVEGIASIASTSSARAIPLGGSRNIMIGVQGSGCQCDIRAGGGLGRGVLGPLMIHLAMTG